MDLSAFYRDFIELTDRVLPTLPSSEQLVYMQIFSRTVAVGERRSRISYQKLGELTNLTWRTVKTAIGGLLSKGLITIEKIASPRVAQTYRITWPVDTKWLSELYRNPLLMLQTTGSGNVYQGLLERLTEEDKTLLRVLEETISPEEEANLRRMAMEKRGRDESIETKYRELLLLNHFGPDRLRKYTRRET